MGEAHVEDGHDGDCNPLPEPYCVVDVSADGDSVSAYQRVEYVGLATDPSMFGPLASLLPKTNVTVHGSDLYVANPVTPWVADAWGTVDGTWFTSGLAGFGREGARVDPNPDWLGSPAPIHLAAIAVAFDEEHGIGYDRVGPFNAPMGTDSDTAVATPAYWGCRLAGESPCTVVVRPGTTFAMAVAPNVTMGLEFYDAELATDPALLDVNEPYPEELPVALPVAVDADPTPLARPSGTPAFAPTAGATAPLGGFHPTGPPPAGVPAAPPAPRAAAPERSLRPALLESNPPAPPVLDLAAIGASLLLTLALSGLYTRFESRQEALASRRRSALLDLVRAEPGIAWMVAARRLGLTRNALMHHVKILERNRAIVVVQEEKKRYLYVPGARPPASAREAIPMGFTTHPVAGPILTALQRTPSGLSREEIHALVPTAPDRTRRYTLERLVRRGLVREAAAPTGGVRLLLALAAAPFDAGSGPK